LANKTIYQYLQRALLIVLLFCVHTLALCAGGDQLPEKPNPPKLVNDYTGTLSASTIDGLERQLVKFSDSTGNQVAIVIIATLNEIPIEDYSYALARKWGIGKNKNDNGVLLLVAKNDRKVRIEVGSGLEGALPDIVSKEIIRTDIAPNFKAGNYDAGIIAAVADICSATQHEYDDVRTPVSQGEGSILPFIVILFIFIFLIFILSRAQRGQTHYMSRRGYRDFERNQGGGGWWINTGGGGFFDNDGSSNGGDSGGFGGFGGGGFSGGGASGDW
jgi:uncharacterized protein